MITGLGMMSGTSADGIDAVLVKFTPGKKPVIGKRVSLAYPAPLRKELFDLAHAETFSVDRIAALAKELGEAHAALAHKAIRTLTPKPGFIALHGQTIRHRPERGVTWQLIDPAPVAAGTGLTVVSDFRTADVAAGGQGAPLLPFAHRVLFQDPKEWTAVVNIGGIANVTLLPPAKSRRENITGFDTGPGNMLIDAFVQRRTGEPFDRNGAIARKGTPSPVSRDWMKNERYFEEPPPKSTGRELFGEAFLKRIEPDLRRLEFEDAVATLTMFTAGTIANQVYRWSPRPPGRMVICGGGALNPILTWAIARICEDCRIYTSDQLGVDPLSVEGAGFALMGYETLQGRPSNIPSVTGASGPVILGRITPGKNYLKLTRALVGGRRSR